MAVAENVPEQTSVNYIEPEMAEMPRISRENASRICSEMGYRVMAIDGEQVKIEPIQEGVHRYPPVRVQVPHDPDFTERYVNMGWYLQSPNSNT